VAIDFEFELLLRNAMRTETTVMLATDELANEVAERVKSYTPEFGDRDPRRSSPPYGEPGEAKAAIVVEPHPTEPLGRRVISRDYKAIWIEVGSRHMPEYAPFTKTAAYYGGTPPIFDSGVRDAQHHLRGELEKLAKVMAFSPVGLKGGIAKSRAIADQKRSVNAARAARSQAFTAARGPRKGRRR
jgi:hypothetical protein